MCIICAKPRGIEMPSFEVLRNCWQGNENGAGISYVRPGDEKVTLLKGFMKLKSLNKTLRALELNKDDAVLIHFRFATHGLCDAGNCHPFPLSQCTDELRARQGKFPVVVAHNGVFGSMAIHDTLSDTQKFVTGVLSNPLVLQGVMEDNKAIKELLLGYCGSSSKLAFLTATKLRLIGDWVDDVETGLVFSNHGFRSYSVGLQSWRNARETEEIFIHKCELCNEKEKVWFDAEYQLFLCEKCLEFNKSLLENEKDNKEERENVGNLQE